ncbi:MAG: 2-oxo-4-hydroxy-4-carboxy-5-ureidoimidazoline decarboxylase [Bryobacteraceae bacterium]
MTLETINSLDQKTFVDQLGWLFEHSPWVAERAWNALPFANLEALHAAMIGAVAAATEQEQLALIRAHPDLGARAKMTEASAGEQAGAGLDQLTKLEYHLLYSRNDDYKRKFGFPFIYAVKGAGKHDVLRALEERLNSDAASERETALQQIGRIAWFRLTSIQELT